MSGDADFTVKYAELKSSISEQVCRYGVTHMRDAVVCHHTEDGYMSGRNMLLVNM